MSPDEIIAHIRATVMPAVGYEPLAEIADELVELHCGHADPEITEQVAAGLRADTRPDPLSEIRDRVMEVLR